MEGYSYKEEIAATRCGSLGSSDGVLLSQVCSLGYIPKSAMKRLAVCKGLIPQEEIPKTEAIIAGDLMERRIYESLAASGEGWESNPLWVSEVYSREHVRLISHPDIVREDKLKKCLYVYEVKTTKYSVQETLDRYRSQLYIHWKLGLERAAKKGRGWKVKLYLVHYDTNGVDLSGADFEPERITVKEVHCGRYDLDIHRAMDIIDTFLATFDEYYDGEEIESEMLPVKVKAEFDKVTAVLREIEERESMVADFKRKLHDFMKEKGIKSIKNELWSIVRTEDSESRSFDGKRYLEEMRAEHPRKAAKLLSEYTKITKRSGYVTIKLK